MLKEEISRNLNVPFVTVCIDGETAYVCDNGSLFLDSEYKNINLKEEYKAREGQYDYIKTKDTGILHAKRAETVDVVSKEQTNEMASDTGSKEAQDKTEEMVGEEQRQIPSRISDRAVMNRGLENNKSVIVICGLLAVTSIICMYVSTLHTATYLYDYVDIFSAWLMSASVTAYSSTAFEVSVVFKHSRKYFLSSLFILLWVFVTFFSMATTVSVFYDRFNFAETQIAKENKEVDSSKLALEMLQKKESDLRRAIDLKVKDIEYRQEREYATTAVRNELNKLESDLQKNLTEQQKLLEKTPEIKETKIQRKESLFTFLGRLMHLEGGVLEFIMSTLSAIFVNLIAPLSIVAVTEMRKEGLTK